MQFSQYPPIPPEQMPGHDDRDDEEVLGEEGLHDAMCDAAEAFFSGLDDCDRLEIFDALVLINREFGSEGVWSGLFDKAKAQGRDFKYGPAMEIDSRAKDAAEIASKTIEQAAQHKRDRGE